MYINIQYMVLGSQKVSFECLMLRLIGNLAASSGCLQGGEACQFGPDSLCFFVLAKGDNNFYFRDLMLINNTKKLVKLI